MKKKRREHDESAIPQQGSPSFRPLESQLKKLAEQKKAEDRAKLEAEAAKAKAKTPGTRGGTTMSRSTSSAVSEATSHREKTLTRDEQRDLDAMAKAQGHDDEFFFARLMSGVRPLGEDKHGRVTSAADVKARPPSAVIPVRNTDDEVRDHLMSLVEGATRFEVSDDGHQLEGRRVDLDTGTWRRVRRGELPIDARIDLHGKSASDARDALETFLREKRTRRDRLVLVIHGRGEHSPAGVGVLRGEISAWLSQGRASQHVAAFATARKDDGGEGALYVLLRS